MELEAYEAPELVPLGEADDLVKWAWSGTKMEYLAFFYECSCC